jgi:predicted membrane protein
VNTFEKIEEEDYPFFTSFLEVFTSYFFFLFLFFPFFLEIFFSFFFFSSFLHEDDKEEKKRKRMFGGEHLQIRSEENQKINE